MTYLLTYYLPMIETIPGERLVHKSRAMISYDYYSTLLVVVVLLLLLLLLLLRLVR